MVECLLPNSCLGYEFGTFSKLLWSGLRHIGIGARIYNQYREVS